MIFFDSERWNQYPNSNYQLADDSCKYFIRVNETGLSKYYMMYQLSDISQLEEYAIIFKILQNIFFIQMSKLKAICRETVLSNFALGFFIASFEPQNFLFGDWSDVSYSLRKQKLPELGRGHRH